MKPLLWFAVLLVATELSAQNYPTKGSYVGKYYMKQYRVDGSWYWKYVPTSRLNHYKPTDKGTHLSFVPPAPPPPAPRLPTPIYVKSYYGGYFPERTYTVRFVFNGEVLTEHGCTELQLVGYSLHYKYQGQDRALSSVTEWNVISTEQLVIDPQILVEPKINIDDPLP